MLFSLLGPVEARDDTGAVVHMKPKVLALLAVLLLRNAKPVTNDEIIKLLWGDQYRSLDTLRGYVAELRTILTGAFGDSVDFPKRRGMQQLSVAPDSVDYHRFKNHLRVGQVASNRADHRTAITNFESALAQFKGKPLAGISGGRLDYLRASLEDEWRMAAINYVEECLKVGSHTKALAEANEYLVRWPDDPKLRRLQIDARSEAGQRSQIGGSADRTLSAELPADQAVRVTLDDKGFTGSANGKSIYLTTAEVYELGGRAVTDGYVDRADIPGTGDGDEFDQWRSRLPDGGGTVLLDTTTVRNALMALGMPRPTPLAMLDLATLSTALVCYDHIVVQLGDLPESRQLINLGAVFLDPPNPALQRRLMHQSGSVLLRMQSQEALGERLALGWARFLGWATSQCLLDTEGWDRQQDSPPSWDGVVASYYMDDLIGIPDDGARQRAFLAIQTLRTFANDALASHLNIPYLAAPFRAPVQTMILREKYQNQRVIERLLQEISPRPADAPRMTDEPYSREFSAPFILGLVLKEMASNSTTRDDYWNVIAAYRERFQPLREGIDRDRADWDGNIGPYVRKILTRASEFGVRTEGMDLDSVITMRQTVVAPQALPIKLASLFEPEQQLPTLVQQQFQPQLYLINSLRHEAEHLRTAAYQVDRIWGHRWAEREHRQLNQLRASNPVPLLRTGELT